MLEEFESRFGDAHSALELHTGDGFARFWAVENRIAVVGLWGRASMETVTWMLARHDHVRDWCVDRNKRMYLALWYGGLKIIDPGTRQALAKWFTRNRHAVNRVVAISHDPVVRMAGFTINMVFGNTGKMAKNDKDFLAVLDGWVTHLRPPR
ncbi:MAG: hypothetical protein AAFQ82_15615 [Myxococcota bacterium]